MTVCSRAKLQFSWCALAFCVGAGSPVSWSAEGVIEIGTATHIWSQTLHEERPLLIHVPESYGRGSGSYPVLYLLDGEIHFRHGAGVVEFLASVRRAPECIVVAVANVERSRDLTTSPPSITPAGASAGERYGGGDVFLRFLTEELIPWVDLRYRTAPFRILAGHSLGGLFALHVLTQRSESFQAYIAISPALWWSGRYDQEQEDIVAAAARLTPPHFLFLGWGNEGNIAELSRQLVDRLQRRSLPGLILGHQVYPDDLHLSTVHRSLYDGLEFIFAPYRHWPVDAMRSGNVAKIEEHYERLSRDYGFRIEPPVAQLTAAADNLMAKGQTQAAVSAYGEVLKADPQNAEALWQLGDLYERSCDFERALDAVERSRRWALDDEEFAAQAPRYEKKLQCLRALSDGRPPPEACNVKPISGSPP